MTNIPELGPEMLRKTCDPRALGFQTTEELPLEFRPIGQPRAFQALKVGSGIPSKGYNMFVLGWPGSGRLSLTVRFLQEQAAQQPTPPDLAYVYNFQDPKRPQALRFPPGQGRAFAQDMQRLLEACRRELPRAFQSDSYRQARERIAQTVQKRQQQEMRKLKKKAQDEGFNLVETPFGFALVPATDGGEGEQTPESPEEDQQREEAKARLEEEIKKTLRRLREIEEKARKAFEELDRRTTTFVVEHLVEELEKKHGPVEGVSAYLQAVQEDIVRNRKAFLDLAEGKIPEAQWEVWSRRYQVNVVVDNGDLKGAPVVVENHPSYGNLLGRIEHEVVMGVTRTDHTLIRAGALHRAAGGYLVLPALDVLLLPYAWYGLKRALREGRVRIIELAADLSLITTVTLEPEPVPLETKVVLIGSPLLYYLLRRYDEDFPKLFKVRAEFALDMPRTPETEKEYALFARIAQATENLPPLDATAVARLVEIGSRLAGHQDKLSTRFGLLTDYLREAAYWAGQNQRGVITAEDLRQAEEARIYRANYLEERIREIIREGVFRVKVEGETVGQMNGLAVIFLGDYAFGRPVRITATAAPGRGEVVDIEKQAELGDPIHTKGVLILGGYLGHQYGHLGPLSLSARITFEQSYEGVEGDSASAAELLALLSAIAQIPLRQDVAITGSVDQHGNIQAVGGVNEKIEGFFATCKALGLTGTQGVILPKANRKHLMLREEVVEAVREGRFHIWAVETIDEAIGLLTGMEPGQRQPDGTFPEGTFHHAVAKRLETFARLVREQGNGDDGAGPSQGMETAPPEVPAV